MARMAINAGDDFALMLSKLEARSEELAAKAIYAGANVVADKIKSNLNSVLSSDASGEMLESFGVTPIDKDKYGNWNAHIGFDGYDEKSVPNQLKARVLESGSSKQRKRPFVRPAVNSTKAEVVRKMNQVISDGIKDL